MTVSVLSAVARGENEILVTLEIREGENFQREKYLLSALLFADLGIKVGECDRERFDAICHAAQVYSAEKKALSLLGFGSCSEKALYLKLVSRGFAKDIAAEAVERISAQGYMDSDGDALREAQRCIFKHWGARRIVAHLRSKGYADESVKRAIYALEDEGVDFSQVCLERLRANYSELPSDREDMRKLVAALSRYGFSSSEIRDAMRDFQYKKCDE